MKKSIPVKPKRGRPATGRDPFVGVRLPAPLIDEIQSWSAKHDLATRSEAIRRLVELGLTVKRKPTQQPVPAGAARAKELAGKAIDKMTDAAASADDQANRKRRLLKGPEEFREARVDRVKVKGK